jgi:hypothetical protein
MPFVHAPPWQVCPQRPQLFASPLVLTHAPPHAVKLPGHAHPPLTHVCPETVQAAHALPPVPQPVAGDGATHVVPPLQQPAQPLDALHTHRPAEHVVPNAHCVPHAPQLRLSFDVSTHALPHTIWPVGHAHPPLTHVCPETVQAVHALPPIPQPVAGDGARHVVPPLQQPTQPLDALHTQRPPEQVVPDAHCVPQAPQLLLSFDMSTHAPPHEEYPRELSHCVVQAPPAQLAVACASAVMHACPQVPQFWVSLCVLAHVLPQRVGAALLQFDVHPEPEQTGVGPVHVTPHAPQFPFCERLMPQPVPASLQSANPGAHW